MTGDTCSFAPGTEEKILRLRTAENKFVLKAGIPNATKVLNGWNAGLRFIFCSVQSLYGFLPTVPGAKEQVSPYIHQKNTQGTAWKSMSRKNRFTKFYARISPVFPGSPARSLHQICSGTFHIPHQILYP